MKRRGASRISPPVETGNDDYAGVAIGDLMSALLMAFMLMTIIYQRNLNEQLERVRESEAEVARREAEIERLQAEIDRMIQSQQVIIGQIAEQLRANSVDIEPNLETGDISIRENLLFDVGSSVLKQEGKELLARLTEVYLAVIFSNFDHPEYRQAVGRIVVEGHTSSEGDDLMNMVLGSARATAVYSFLLSEPSLLEERGTAAWTDFRSTLVFSSRGEIEAAREPLATDRRVVFRFQFRTAENIMNLLGE